MQSGFIIIIPLIIIGLIIGVSGSTMRAWDDCTWTSANTNIITGTADLNPQVSFIHPANILQIGTNHWNQGNGTQSPGTIALVHEDGTTYGPWQTQGQVIYNVSNTWWWSFPDEIIKPGNYSVIDSDLNTLSANNYSQGSGFASIEYEYLKSDAQESETRLSIERVDAPTSVMSCGKREDLKVFWAGTPHYPLTLYILPKVEDPKTYDWKSVVSEYSYNNFTYPLYVPDALSCCQVDNTSIQYDLVLVNGDSVMSDPFPVSFSCPRYYLK